MVKKLLTSLANIGQQSKSLLLSTSKYSSSSSNNKKERLFAPLVFIPFNPAKIAVVFFGDSEGSKEFHKASFLTPLV